MAGVKAEKTDKAGYDALYRGRSSGLSAAGGRESYRQAFEARWIAPFHAGGHTKGYVRGEAVRRLLEEADALGRSRDRIRVLDAGCGLGELSVYLAAIGFDVTGVDISVEARASGQALATEVGVADHCRFLAESLESTTIDDASIDFVVGHASLHHFIKYEGVPSEFRRVMKDGAMGFFADAFGENRLFSVFHDKEKMRRLGDVPLSKALVEEYFQDFEVSITPTDWFVMLDKLYLKILPKSLENQVRRLSRIHFLLDRRLPASSRTALALSGSVLTQISKKTAYGSVAAV